MTLTPASRGHDWSFHASARGDVAILVAVCRGCGLLRSEVAASQREGRIDLSGQCQESLGGQHMVRSRTMSIERLKPAAPRERQPSPRQLAAQQREATIRKALAKLKPGHVVVVEPDEGEKLPTLRLALNRVLSGPEYRDLHVAGRDGAFYVASEPLPFGRKRSQRRDASGR